MALDRSGKMSLLPGRNVHVEIDIWRGMIFAAVLYRQMIDCRYKGTHKPMTQILTNYSYPGVCFTKYAPGPADQPNRSNLTAWPAKKVSTASDSPHPLLPYSSRMTIPPGTRSGKRYFSATS